jgi:hypothetical protein
MKAILFLLLTTVCALSQDTTNAPASCPATVGRFQLVAATVVKTTPTGTVTEPRLFRIDTATGNVWGYTATQLPMVVGTTTVPREIDGWTLISANNPIDQWSAALTNMTPRTTSKEAPQSKAPAK